MLDIFNSRNKLGKAAKVVKRKLLYIIYYLRGEGKHWLLALLLQQSLL